MSRFNHITCDACYQAKHPGREPTLMKDIECQTCCFCGTLVLSVIWIRHNPADEKLICKGAEH
jgi:hypothetical protein